MCPSRRIVTWIVAAIVVFGLPLGYYNFILDWQGKPYCHAQIVLALENWIERNANDSRSRTSPFPNVGGVARDSLDAIREEMENNMDWAPREKGVRTIYLNCCDLFRLRRIAGSIYWFPLREPRTSRPGLPRRGGFCALAQRFANSAM
jgi:hypothetical protein